MELPKIKVRLSKNYCLYDFLLRLLYFGSFKNEKVVYFKKLKKTTCNFMEFLEENRGRSFEFFVRHLSEFDNPYFEKLWDELYPCLKRQHSQIRKVILKHGKSYLREILRFTKIRKYPYREILVYLSFPAIEEIKPKKYRSTGTFTIHNEKCIVTLGLEPNFKCRNGRDLFILWHELIHSLDIPGRVWCDIDEAIAQLYGDMVSGRPREIIEDRIKAIFYHKYPKEIALSMIETCLNWDWKNNDIFQLKFALANLYKNALEKT